MAGAHKILEKVGHSYKINVPETKISNLPTFLHVFLLSYFTYSPFYTINPKYGRSNASTTAVFSWY